MELYMNEPPIAPYPPKPLAGAFLHAGTRRRVSLLLRFSGIRGKSRRSFSASSRNTISIAFAEDKNRPRMLSHCRKRAALSSERCLILERARSQRFEGVNCRTRGRDRLIDRALLLSVVGHCYLCTRDPRCGHNLPIFPWGCCPMFITRGMLNVAKGGSRARGEEG